TDRGARCDSSHRNRSGARWPLFGDVQLQNEKLCAFRRTGPASHQGLGFAIPRARAVSARMARADAVTALARRAGKDSSALRTVRRRYRTAPKKYLLAGQDRNPAGFLGDLPNQDQNQEA